MDDFDVRRSRRGGAAIAAVTLALALGACGDSDGDSGSGGGSTPRGDASSEASAAPIATTPDQRQILAVLAATQKAMDNADGKAACRHLSKLARQGFAQLGKDCADGFNAQFASNEVTEDPNPKISAVEVDGAAATVKGTGRRLYASDNAAHPTSKPRPVSAAFVKERGEWKVQEWFTD